MNYRQKKKALKEKIDNYDRNGMATGKYKFDLRCLILDKQRESKRKRMRKYKDIMLTRFKRLEENKK